MYIDRKDIVVVPFSTERPITHRTGVNEAMDYMSLVRTELCWREDGIKRTLLNCVLANKGEIIALVRGYYGLIDTRLVTPALIRCLPAKRTRVCGGFDNVVFERYRAQNLNIDDEEDNRTIDATFSIYYHWNYPIGEAMIQKCGNIILCSEWGYQLILDWYK